MTLLEATTKIVTAMIETNKIDRNDNNRIDNESILKALDDVYKKLEELEHSATTTAS